MFNKLTRFDRHFKLIVVIFFVFFLITGLAIYKDYGASWDEHLQRITGIVFINYIVDGNKYLFEYVDRYYGPVFEVFLVAVERMFGFNQDSQSLYYMRHLMTFLLFYISVFYFYRLCKVVFNNDRIGLLAALMLILSPRIFAHAFYNTKDLAFLSMFTIGVYTHVQFLKHKTIGRAFIHALICAWAIDIRILGVLLPVFTAIFYLADMYFDKESTPKTSMAWRNFALFAAMAFGLTVLFWPTLWPDPIGHIIGALKHMSHYPSDGNVLYMGEFVPSKALPWHYVPVWMLITTPIVYTVCFFAGMIFIVQRVIKNPRQFYIQHKPIVFSIIWLFVPILMVIVLKSVLYDGWRQIFFVYPGLLLIAMFGLANLYDTLNLKMKNVLCIIVAICILQVGWVMVKIHPFQNVYFNRLAGAKMSVVKDRFDMDYWGLSYRRALEYILANDKRDKIKLAVLNSPGRSNAYILKASERARLDYVDDLKQADYFLSNYRKFKGEYPFGKEYYALKVGDANIMVVYKLKGY